MACREAKGTFTVKYDDVKAVELSLSAQTIDGVWVSSAQGLTSYRVEVWEDDRWKTVYELDTYSRSLDLYDIIVS